MTTDDQGDAAVHRALAALAAIRLAIRHGSPRVAVAGVIACPTCGGTLSYKVQSNQHVWAQCSTPECVAFLQ